ncbi:electron transport complex subunit RsxC [Endozoicomonas arenosclerae]|uniref:electron transport complex subunit RsxC n=1 Tax=Endozoicomonas arenosclerae TaxID=1633495 RepID=UPI000781EB5F|nr:electron transport complex subunit RsxC [Endozoicomonas arenosclerae]
MNLPLKDITESKQRVWPLTGGVHPEENKHQSTSTPIRPAPMPEKLTLPLSQHAGAPAEPIVAVGDKVLKGQMIAKATGFVSVPVHAPTSGTITAIGKEAIPHPSGMHDDCITLIPDGLDQWCELSPVKEFQSVNPLDLVNLIRDSGIAGMGGAGFPTAVKLSPRSPIHTLILNGTECEPYITADDMLMRERAEAIVAGAEILKYLLNSERCLIGIEDNKPEAIEAVKKAVSQSDNSHYIKVVVFPTKYPSGGEKQLIQILTGQEVPSGKLPSDLGIAVQNVGTAVAVNDAVHQGKPLISRITTLTGEALSSPGNLEVLLGTSTRHLLKTAAVSDQKLATLIMGGPMMGFTLDDLDVPVTKTTNCLIAGTREEFPPAMPAQACIRCGMCAEACPASLLPQQLYWHAKSENHEQLKHHNLFDCIECGACSFVCPSSIPLVQYYRASKGEIRAQEAKHAKAERSKVRYESRQARLEKEQAEKEAKRRANAERAAKLKAAKEASAKQDSSSSTTAAVDPVQAAIERAKAKKAAGATASKPAKTVLSAEQKELKIQLSLANAQLKKTRRALTIAQEKGEGDVEKLTADVSMLETQVAKLQKEFDAASATEQPKVATPDAEAAKKLKIESAMAKAALKKSERALATALEEGNSETEALKEAVEESRKKAEALAKELADATTAAPAKPAAADDEKKLKIEQAMAKAALKKAERALNKAREEGSSELAELEKAVEQSQKKLDALTPAQSQASSTNSQEKSSDPADDKKLKIEKAMAKAALKKAERELAKAQESGSEDIVSLESKVDECRKKLEQLEEGKPSVTVTEPEVSKAPAKVQAGDDLKKLKIENAMARAAVKKAQRALENAEGDTSALETVLIEAQTKAAEAEKALAAGS